jgi:hypothetical protein
MDGVGVGEVGLSGRASEEAAEGAGCAFGFMDGGEEDVGVGGMVGTSSTRGGWKRLLGASESRVGRFSSSMVGLGGSWRLSEDVNTQSHLSRTSIYLQP